jgi:hypothetical protein
MLLIFIAGGLLAGTCIITMILLPAQIGSMEWIAIVLWSIELFPQLYLNLAEGSTQGQAGASLLLTFMGKTTDFASAFLLNMPDQTHVLAFFSSSQAYVNIMQYLYYR